MVTTSKPDTNRNDIRYPQMENADVREGEHTHSSLARLLDEVLDNPTTVMHGETRRWGSHKTKTGLIARITRPLLSVYGLVSGPPMSQRDRNCLAVVEARVKNNASLNWFHRTTWQ